MAKDFDFLPPISFLELPLAAGSFKKRDFSREVMAFAKFDQRKGNRLAEESTYRPEIGEERVTARHGKLRPPSLAGD